METRRSSQIYGDTKKMIIHPPRILFLLEEESMAHFLDAILPKIVPSCIFTRCIPYQGKDELRISIRKMLIQRHYPNTHFVILHDQDNHDCMQLKSELKELCAPSGRNPLIRIVCHELEAWYFGDLDAVANVYKRFKPSQYRRKNAYRTPDDIVKPSKAMEEICAGFTKINAAREIPKYMDVENNNSESFRNTISGIKDLVTHIQSQTNSTPCPPPK